MERQWWARCDTRHDHPRGSRYKSAMLWTTDETDSNPRQFQATPVIHAGYFSGFRTWGCEPTFGSPLHFLPFPPRLGVWLWRLLGGCNNITGSLRLTVIIAHNWSVCSEHRPAAESYKILIAIGKDNDSRFQFNLWWSAQKRAVLVCRAGKNKRCHYVLLESRHSVYTIYK